MFTMIVVAALLVAFATTLISVPLVRWIAIERDWIDSPDDDRKAHRRPTPNLGGLAVAAGFTAGLLAIGVLSRAAGIQIDLPIGIVLIGGIVMIGTGFYDDIKWLSFRKKFLLQLAVAYGLLLAGYRIDLSTVPLLSEEPFTQALISIPLTLMWIVGIINAVNLLDGLDGLASGVAMIAFGCLAILLVQTGSDAAFVAMALLMVGALAGFLIYNFHPASIFLGDSGSLFVGYLLAVFSLRGGFHPDPLVALIVPVVVLGLPILDTTLCFVRRIVAGKSPYAPDSDHIHHRLNRLFSHRKAVLILYVAAIWLSVAALLMTRSSATVGFLIFVVTLLAALIGIRTLGYVDLDLFDFRAFKRSRQLKLEFEASNERFGDSTPSLRRQNHHELAASKRTLPVRVERHRAAWRRDIGQMPEQALFVGPEEQMISVQVNGDRTGTGNESGNGSTNGSGL